MKRVLVIGAGASGMMAAISAASNGAQVTIYEKSDRVGRKILATGNGKCNLSNKNMDITNYYTEDVEKLSRCFKQFSVSDTIRFFNSIGLMIRERDGYLYPYCEQASVVLDILRKQVQEQKIKLYTSVENILLTSNKSGRFKVSSSIGTKEFDSIILACGSKAGMKNAGTEGYDYAKLFGHRIIPLFPALVQVRCEGDFFKAIAGVRCKVKIALYVEDSIEAEEKGELQLTDYGISGIPVFQISRIIAKKLHSRSPMRVKIDFLPDMEMDRWNLFVEERIIQCQGYTCEEFLTGILHKKISMMLLKKYGLKPTDVLDAETKNRMVSLCKEMKSFCVIPTGVNSFEQAQVCCGGVDFRELDDVLQSIYQPELFICGEMVDIDGKCGGYNLQWAWTSGYIAGCAAAKERK